MWGLKPETLPAAHRPVSRQQVRWQNIPFVDNRLHATGAGFLWVPVPSVRWPRMLCFPHSQPLGHGYRCTSGHRLAGRGAEHWVSEREAAEECSLVFLGYRHGAQGYIEGGGKAGGDEVLPQVDTCCSTAVEVPSVPLLPPGLPPLPSSHVCPAAFQSQVDAACTPARPGQHPHSHCHSLRTDRRTDYILVE